MSSAETSDSSCTRRSLTLCSVARLLVSMMPAALASSWPCSSKARASWPRSVSTWLVTSRKPPILDSMRPVASPVATVTSFMALTNSDTRSISVFSSALMFSCEPDSTSCSSTFASRRRPNKAVVSARSMLCVCMISLTVAVAVSCDVAIACCAVSCRLERVRLTLSAAVSPAALIRRAICSEFSATDRLRP